MTTLHLVKVKHDGHLRIMEITDPPRFGALVKLINAAYSLDETVTLTYTDGDGDQVKLISG